MSNYVIIASNKYLTQTNMKESVLSRQSPFVYFWLGILTGALIIVGSLMIQSGANNDGTASILRTTTTDYSRTTTSPTATTTIISPETMLSIGTPGM